ncbi:MAG: hypothetical protein WBA68_03330 [Alteraurantiacibacter sp.]
MATAKRAKTGLVGIVVRVALVLVVIAGVAWLLFGREIGGFSETGTAFAAKTACSCRFVAGREIGTCGEDLGAGFEAVWLSEDTEAMTVTARVPAVASATASYSEDGGCVLERWDR